MHVAPRGTPKGQRWLRAAGCSGEMTWSPYGKAQHQSQQKETGESATGRLCTHGDSRKISLVLNRKDFSRFVPTLLTGREQRHVARRPQHTEQPGFLTESSPSLPTCRVLYSYFQLFTEPRLNFT